MTVNAITEFVLRSPVGVGLLGLAVGLGLVGMGLTCVIGARKGWRWLVDPPREAWFWYSQAFVKVVAGVRVLRVWNCVFGVLCIVGGLLNVFGGVATLVYHAR